MYLKENVVSNRHRFAVNRGGLVRGRSVMGGPAGLGSLGIDPLTAAIGGNIAGKLFGGIFGGPPDPEKLHKKSEKLAAKAAELRAAGKTKKAEKKLAKSQKKHEKAVKFGFPVSPSPASVTTAPAQVTATVPQIAASALSPGAPSQQFVSQPTQAPIILGSGGGTLPASAFTGAANIEAGTPRTIGEQLSSLAIPLSIGAVGLMFLLSRSKKR